MPCINDPAKPQTQQPVVQQESEQQFSATQEVENLQVKAVKKPGSHHNKLSDDEKKALDIHNQARTEVSHTPLSWDPTLAAHAAAYAQQLANSNSGLQHSSGDARPGEGENLYWSSPNGSLADASAGWVAEKGNYHGEKIGEGDFGGYGHYTQMVLSLPSHLQLPSPSQLVMHLRFEKLTVNKTIPDLDDPTLHHANQ
ncbi:MAG: hypothetical protein L6R41_004769 [Letrouitia leprolyta]|nr:MAG: hypothetical protein L6R41_004769 [Letrouitia leprolyta]